MIIDFHTHIMPPKVRENRGRYAAEDRSFAAVFSSPKARLATVEELLAGMERDGIDFSVVLNYGWSTQKLCIETNDYILESVARYPKRLAGFCSVQPAEPGAVKELERCVRAGIKGVGELRADLQGFQPDNKSLLEPLVEIVRQYNLIWLTHASEPMGHDYPGKGSLTPSVLFPFIADYPDIKIVCAHWGGGLPFYALMPEVKTAMQNVYFDSAASPFLYSASVYRQVSNLVGAERILFGSDFPLLAQGRVLKELQQAELAEEEKKLVAGGNAQKLLGIKGK